MSIIYSAPAPAHSAAGPSRIGDPAAILKRWWMAYIAWRIEQAAIAQLVSMSDRALKDIGLTRGQIPGAVRGEVRDQPFSRYY